jgi:3-deoxy-D-manno-octulosonic-acid transferase
VSRHLYTLVFAAGLVLMAPVFAVRALRHKKYLGSLGERFGAARVDASDLPTLWFHAVSVGETLAVEPLVRAVVAALPNWRVVLSTTTATGQRVARERFPDLEVLTFPLDLPFAVERALDRVRPSVVCLVETEIWPNFLAACRRRGVRVALVNGRLSDNSYRGYHRIRGLLAPVLADVELFLMQSEADAERIGRLGARTDRVEVSGNLKYDVDREALEARLDERRAAVEAAFALPDPRPLVVAGSTAPGEVAALADALDVVRAQPGLEATRLLVAPRHPERFDDVARLFESRGLTVCRRSTPDAGAGADVLLLDSIGELATVYAHADVVFVGGSLVPRGGHNIIEPALYARPIIVGPHTENFRQIVADFRAADAVEQLSAGAGGPELGSAIARILADSERARRMGDRAVAVLDGNRGATVRMLERVCGLASAVDVGAAARSRP